jgi:NAD(P)-dependent dehydrogenase (short-subunit alcohol dehydrogenase family)
MHAIVTGGRGGLGRALVSELAQHYNVTIWDLPNVDVTSTQSIRNAITALKGAHVDLLVNCAGVNVVNYLKDLTPTQWHKVMAVNATGIYNTVHALLPLLRDGTVCNIISNASHVPMTASIAYNASKAAAHMMTRQMAHELFVTDRIIVFGVSPNRLAGTAMSSSVDAQVSKVRGWTWDEVKAKQTSSLPVGAETPINAVAELVGWLLTEKARHYYLHGCILPYGS